MHDEEMEGLRLAIEAAKDEIQQEYTMDNIGAFRGNLARNVEAATIHESIYIAKALKWLAEAHVRRGTTIAIFSELSAQYGDEASPDLLFERERKRKEFEEALDGAIDKPS